MGLTKYIQKRRFNETPEPRGKLSKPRGALKFVIQKHQASRLHYDFRLEMGGVLKSWAVPKGPSAKSHDKRLAMMTEDHPMDYRTFEGTIPEGNYGAGDVIVWDEGTYEAEGATGLKDSEQRMLAGLRKGEMVFAMHGQKVKGLYALIKLKGKEENAWLLFKKSDEYVSDRPLTDNQSSVRSDKSLGDAPHSKIARLSKKGATPMPHRIKPMLATLVDGPFDRPGWLFEIKWDGYRAVAEIENNKVKLYSRNLQDFNGRYPEVVKALEKLGHDLVLDGEVVVINDQGKSDFQDLQNYGKTRQGNVQYYVFDLLYLDGHDLTAQPLGLRKDLLKVLIPKQSIIKYSDHVVEKGKSFFRAAVKQGLEGIIAKDGQSQYRHGRRTEDWLKIKTSLRQEVVIAGFTEPRNSRKYFGSLVLGVYDKDRLRYVGHTGTGFNVKSLQYIYDKLQKLVQKQSPFDKPPKTNMPVTWVKPQLIAEVAFSEWTEDRQMRHPSFRGLREDKAPQEVRQEREASTEQTPKANQNSIAIEQVLLTNLGKIYWPKEKYTKGDLIEYYRQISPVILPYLKDRPESLHRHPNGINGQSFFQKNVLTAVPEFVGTTEIKLETENKTIKSVVCNNQDTLLYLANLGCIELNPWSARVGRLDYPDWAVIDLDPGKIGFDKVIEAAQATHKILDKINVPSFPKTSGKTGLHIFVPLAARYDFDHIKQFVEIIVTLVYKRLPQTTSLERTPSKRMRKIYLDYLQNRIGQTLAAPYCVRPWPGATVSAPLQWKEIKKGLDPAKFTMFNIFKRIDKLGDLWQPVLGKGVDLKEALKELEKIVK